MQGIAAEQSGQGLRNPGLAQSIPSMLSFSQTARIQAEHNLRKTRRNQSECSWKRRMQSPCAQSFWGKMRSRGQWNPMLERRIRSDCVRRLRNGIPLAHGFEAEARAPGARNLTRISVVQNKPCFAATEQAQGKHYPVLIAWDPIKTCRRPKTQSPSWRKTEGMT